VTLQFAFDLDNDLTKYVRIEHSGELLTITVRYGFIAVEDEHVFSVPARRFETEPATLGVWVRFLAPLLPWLGWPLVWRRRFF
jgi:hypothetical protein